MKINELNSRSADIFRQIVETFLKTGDPVGSAKLSGSVGITLSSASIRNTMADLERSGLLYSPHTSAGRMPTEAGLRLFVDGLLEFGTLSKSERGEISARCKAEGRQIEDVLAEAAKALSGLSNCAGMVLVPRFDAPLKHIEFVQLRPGHGLVILVTADGHVENRAITLPLGLPPSALAQASNYLNAHLDEGTLEDVSAAIKKELKSRRAQLDELTKGVVKAGLATLSTDADNNATLIVRGRANLLEDASALENLERIRQLFDELETKEGLQRLLEATRQAEGVRIFIGAENKLFSLSGSSVVVAPYANEAGKVIGAIGVIGPTRINYARIIPMVDYTARMIGTIL